MKTKKCYAYCGYVFEKNEDYIVVEDDFIVKNYLKKREERRFCDNECLALKLSCAPYRLGEKER